MSWREFLYRPSEDCVVVGCLALNASYEPLTMVPMRRALRLVIDGKAEIVEAGGRATVRMVIPIAVFVLPVPTVPEV